MAFTHTLAWSYATSGDAVNSQLAATAESETRMDVAVPASSTDLLVAYTLDFSQCKGFFLLADAAMTVETNSSSAPDQTFTLAANVPVAWVDGDGTCPVTDDITAIYVTSAAGGTLKIRSLVDPTV